MRIFLTAQIVNKKGASTNEETKKERKEGGYEKRERGGEQKNLITGETLVLEHDRRWLKKKVLKIEHNSTKDKYKIVCVCAHSKPKIFHLQGQYSSSNRYILTP